MVVRLKVTLTGEHKYIGETAKRAKRESLRANAVNPWMKWKTDVQILDMYRRGGTVRGEQARWAPNKPGAKESKGHTKPMLSRSQFRFGTMSRSYKTKAVGHHNKGWTISLWNTKWYAGYLHDPGKTGRFRVPRVGNENAKTLRYIGPGGVVFAKVTHPSYPKPRPNILFFQSDEDHLMARAAWWILDGKRFSHRKKVRH